jgi:hypothetical protein
MFSSSSDVELPYLWNGRAGHGAVMRHLRDAAAGIWRDDAAAER